MVGSSFQINHMMRLAVPIFGSSCDLTTDNWYTSVLLAEDRMKNKVTLVGTMREKKSNIPPELSGKT